MLPSAAVSPQERTRSGAAAVPENHVEEANKTAVETISRAQFAFRLPCSADPDISSVT